MDHCFSEDDRRTSEEAKAEVGWWVFGDLFVEAGGEAKEVVVYSGADDGEGVVHICEEEEGFAFRIGDRNIGGVEGG